MSDLIFGKAMRPRPDEDKWVAGMLGAHERYKSDPKYRASVMAQMPKGWPTESPRWQAKWTQGPTLYEQWPWWRRAFYRASGR